MFTPAPDAQPGEQKLGKTPRVLIIDDSLAVRGSIRAALDKLEAPIAVIEAASGDEALSIMHQVRVDMVFCDIHLPGMSGPEALALAYPVRDQRPFMVMMSSLPLDAVRDISRELRAYAFLHKPFRASDVLKAVEAYDRLNAPARVLLVDDSETARKLMHRILERSQFRLEIEEAGSGAQALHKAAGRDFDVVFLDAHMPGLTGPQTAAQMLQAHPRTQIVMISTEQPRWLVRDSQYSGAFAFLKKPFDPLDVDAVLHAAFSIRMPNLARPTHAIYADADARAVAGTANSR